MCLNERDDQHAHCSGSGQSDKNRLMRYRFSDAIETVRGYPHQPGHLHPSCVAEGEASKSEDEEETTGADPRRRGSLTSAEYFT
jgi:hypothetical protein